MNPADLYFDLEGRTPRKDWWIGLTPLAIMGYVLPDTFHFFLYKLFAGYLPSHRLYAIAILASVALLLHPILAIFIKRLHDVGRSGWWAFFILMPPFIIMLLIMLDMPPLFLFGHPLGRMALHAQTALALWFIGEMAFRPGQTAKQD